MNKEIIEKARTIILDFDGTLVDSNDIKRTAFEKCFTNHSAHFEEIMAYCKGNNHTPRKEKFRHVFENILKTPYTAETEKKMLERYASQTTEQVIAAKEIPGAFAFLDKYLPTKELVLLSSTPHDILLHILERRGMKKYFRTVQGAPVNKAEWIKKFITEQNLKKEEVVFIGDSPEDQRAALESGVAFYLPNFNPAPQTGNNF
ncbi:MAG: HAD hydrolase-like protein [Deltaproteobacteria bacterium]|nr:HAD hydrolase-like protein [Deltaproteobacteria bacterium]